MPSDKRYRRTETALTDQSGRADVRTIRAYQDDGSGGESACFHVFCRFPHQSTDRDEAQSSVAPHSKNVRESLNAAGWVRDTVVKE